ncbi:MAG: HEPN domain-containing protein [Caldilineales bacterium]|nr:HEPN domain-containing protein [Caldilineales bacterium]MCW5859172.1 HEPN domain-containing protein [Caldilineales bacterium]
MEEYARAYARLRLERAREELQTAEENIANGHFRAAVSRSYYAIFYMASAALFSQSVQRSKHSGVESAFAEHLVKSGQIESVYSRSYQRVRRLREEADYAERVEIDESTARQTLAEAERFVTRVEKFLNEVEIL